MEIFRLNDITQTLDEMRVHHKQYGKSMSSYGV